MKRLLRIFVIETVALYLTSQIAHGMIFEKGVQGLLVTGFALTIASYIVKPVINMLLIPINLLTFNIFRFVTSAITLYLVDLVLVQFKITGFSFVGLNTDLVYLPSITLSTSVLYYLAFSIIISLIAGIIHWLVR